MANLRDARQLMRPFVAARVVTQSSALACHSAAMMRHGITTHRRTEPVTAYVNDGRWVADCPCGSGILLVPGWTLGTCFECGGIASIVWPSEKDIVAIDDALGARTKRSTMNWTPVEAVDALTLETLVNEAAEVRR